MRHCTKKCQSNWQRRPLDMGNEGWRMEASWRTRSLLLDVAQLGGADIENLIGADTLAQSFPIYSGFASF